jgi:serine/threonine-protein kinase
VVAVPANWNVAKGDMEESGKAGKYDLLAVIGRGAVGVVFEGFDPILARKVAIKTLPLDHHDDEAREQYTRFQQEAQAAGRLHHPNIVAVFDYGETATHAFIVMEYLPGGSLKARLERRGRVTTAEALAIMQGILAGLQHSHEHGVVHRDIKPANIVFDDAGEVKITDFGIARLESSKLTLAGTLLGTPAYMSPEQVLGETADVRSDIYSAGVILYELLSGQRPFEGVAASIMHKIVYIPPPLPSTLPAAVPPLFDAILTRALAKSPDDRFQSAADFARALREMAEKEQHVSPPPPGDTVNIKQIAKTEAVDDRTVVAPLPAMSSAVTGRSPRSAPSTVDPVDTKVATRALSPKAVTPPPATMAQPGPSGRLSPAALGAVLAVVLLAGAGGGYLLLGGFSGNDKPGAVPPPSPGAHNPSSGPPAAKPPIVDGNGIPAGGPDVSKPSNPQGGPAKTPEPHVADKSPPIRPLDPTAELRSAVSPIVASMPCSLVRADFPTGQAMKLTGWTSLGETADILAESTMRGALAKVPNLANVDPRIRQINGPFCSLFDVLRPVFAAQQESTFSIAVAGDPTRLNDGATMQLQATMPPFAALLRIDRFEADGSVVHLLAPEPNAAPMNPGSVIPLGAGAGTISAWTVTKADGPSVVVAVASSLPLALGQRPIREPALAYLADMTPALKDAQNNGRVSAAVTVIGTAAP